MLLLFAGGVMNLAVIAALTVLVAFELAPFAFTRARQRILLSGSRGYSIDRGRATADPR